MMFWIFFSTVNRSKQLVYDLKKETRFDLEQMTETWMHDADFSTQKTAVFDYFTYPSDREKNQTSPRKRLPWKSKGFVLWLFDSRWILHVISHMRTMMLEYVHQHLPLPKITQ